MAQLARASGYEATKVIRGLDHPDAGTIPIVAMTANAFGEDKKEAFDAGMTGYLMSDSGLRNQQ